MGFISISVLDTKDNKDVGTPITAKVEGTIKNLIGQSRVLEFKETQETDAVYYVSTFRVDDEDRYNHEIKVTQSSQKRTIDEKFRQQFYFEVYRINVTLCLKSF